MQTLRSRASGPGAGLWPAAMVVLALLAGCAPGARVAEEEVELVWPLPPETPRIKYLRSVRSDKDVGGADRSLRDTLLGTEKGALGLAKPYGVHVDKDGRMFVSDTGWGVVMVFDLVNDKRSAGRSELPPTATAGSTSPTPATSG